MSNDNASLGKVSLWSSIIGVVLPGCIAVLVFFIEKNTSEQSLSLGYVIYGFVICGFLFVTLELVALGCGIAARRTTAGNAGLVISAGIVFLVLLFYLYSWIRFGAGGDAPPSASP